jgi:hypothetical protein
MGNLPTRDWQPLAKHDNFVIYVCLHELLSCRCRRRSCRYLKYPRRAFHICVEVIIACVSMVVVAVAVLVQINKHSYATRICLDAKPILFLVHLVNIELTRVHNDTDTAHCEIVLLCRVQRV